jgi:DNA-binding MarR family transcriptional regulator
MLPDVMVDLLHDKTRLSIMSKLSSMERPLSFVELLEALKLTRGNLSTHLKKLEEASFILVDKQFVDRKPLSTYSVSETGRKALKDFLQEIEAMLARIVR